MQQDDEVPSSSTPDPGPSSTVDSADPFDDLTRAFVRLSNLPTCPLDRLSRYEATPWRQACQVLFTLQCLDWAANHARGLGCAGAAINFRRKKLCILISHEPAQFSAAQRAKL